MSPMAARNPAKPSTAQTASSMTVSMAFRIAFIAQARNAYVDGIIVRNG
jgi:hypothetical protein